MSEVANSSVQETPKAEEPAKQESAPEQKPQTEPKQEPVAEKQEAGGEKKTEDSSSEQKSNVPEKYELSLPEDSILEASALERVAAIARERGLSNEQAQELLESESKNLSAFVDERSNKWMGEVQSDKELGGDGFKENAELAKRVVERFGTDTLRKELDKTGYGNHPELVRLLVRIGKAMSNDKLVIPGAQSGGQKSLEDIFYGKQNQT